MRPNYTPLRDAAYNRKLRLEKVRKMLEESQTDEMPLKRFIAEICLELGVKRRRAVEYLKTFEDAELISMNNYTDRLKIIWRQYL